MNIERILLLLSAMRIRIEINVDQKEKICAVCQLPESRTGGCTRTDCPLRDELPDWLKNKENREG